MIMSRWNPMPGSASPGFCTMVWFPSFAGRPPKTSSALSIFRVSARTSSGRSVKRRT